MIVYVDIIKWAQKRFSKMRKSFKFPESYFVGEEYVKDPIRISIEIQVLFKSSGEIKAATLNISGREVSLIQYETILCVTFMENISGKLFRNIKNINKGSFWILPYVSEVMPYVNKEILDQRYRSGHFLIETYSNMDIYQLWLINKKTNERARVSWPQAITSHPLAIELASKYNRVYVRDLIDSIHAYFKGDYEECIRKSITSIETFIKYHRLEVLKTSGGLDFKKTIKQNLNFHCPFITKSTAEVIWDAYKIRNDIVHDGKRLDPIEGKALGKLTTHMVNEVYKNYGTEDDLKRYAFYLETQFLAQEGFLGVNGDTLKTIEERKSKI